MANKGIFAATQHHWMTLLICPPQGVYAQLLGTKDLGF
jgi:hypothetical protein